ncbi:hypothetical protein [Nocardiopsis gilva]|nr:hypothetical protein [Nocardiopsis gilva]
MERRKHVRYLHACGVSSGDIVRIQQGELDEAEAIAAATPRGSRGQTPEAQARRNRVWGRIALGVICLGATLFIPPLVVVMVPLFVVGWFLVNKIMPVELAEHETDRDFRLVYGSRIASMRSGSPILNVSVWRLTRTTSGLAVAHRRGRVVGRALGERRRHPCAGCRRFFPFGLSLGGPTPARLSV